MKKKEIIVAWIGGIIILIACIYPPWVYTYQEQGISQVSKPAGYHFIFDTPSVQTPTAMEYRNLRKHSNPSNLYGVAVDFVRLLIEIFVIIIITLLVILSLRYYCKR